MTERQVELHERLAMPEAVLTRTDLAYPRRAVDVIFKHVTREAAGYRLFRGSDPLEGSTLHPAMQSVLAQARRRRQPRPLGS